MYNSLNSKTVAMSHGYWSKVFAIRKTQISILKECVSGTLGPSFAY